MKKARKSEFGDLSRSKAGAFVVGNTAVPIGTIHGTDTLFFREHVGTARNGAHEYEMDLNMGGRTPIIRSKTSGRSWTCTWQEMLAVAVASGIDALEEPEVRS